MLVISRDAHRGPNEKFQTLAESSLIPIQKQESAQGCGSQFPFCCPRNVIPISPNPIKNEIVISRRLEEAWVGEMCFLHLISALLILSSLTSNAYEWLGIWWILRLSLPNKVQRNVLWCPAVKTTRYFCRNFWTLARQRQQKLSWQQRIMANKGDW